MAEVLPPTHLSYFNNQHPLVISSDPQSVAGDHESPLLHSVLVSARSCICKALAVVGVVHRDVLFSSDRTSKESACCFTALNTPGNPNIRQTGLVSLPLSVRFPPLFLASPSSLHLPQPFPFFFLTPHTSLTVSESPQLSTHSVILLSKKKKTLFGLVSGPGESVCHVSSLCPVCTRTDHT